MRRTGHSSRVMLARYRREAAPEIDLRWYAPLTQALPEFSWR